MDSATKFECPAAALQGTRLGAAGPCDSRLDSPQSAECIEQTNLDRREPRWALANKFVREQQIGVGVIARQRAVDCCFASPRPAKRLLRGLAIRLR
jgi:hypothetical protein